MHPIILFLILTVIAGNCAAQTDSLNQVDETGKRQGYWIFHGADRPHLDYPNNGKIEEGIYKDDRKVGYWTKYHLDGETPRLKGFYVNGRPYGEYWKFYPTGEWMEHGFFYAGKNKNTLERYYESGCLFYMRNDSILIYYNDDCDKDSSRVGSIQKEHSLPINPVVCRSPVEPVPEVKKIETDTTKAPTLDIGHTLFDLPKKKDGHNKLYNEQDEIIIDGTFKEGKLWEGKYYIYDQDGILLQVQQWKYGRYIKNYQL